MAERDRQRAAARACDHSSCAAAPAVGRHAALRGTTSSSRHHEKCRRGGGRSSLAPVAARVSSRVTIVSLSTIVIALM
eukprot:3830920-Prymnesium_polylepis.1